MPTYAYNYAGKHLHETTLLYVEYESGGLAWLFDNNNKKPKNSTDLTVELDKK
jgi:hypothetical protein